ncbi:Dyp-type peroxidase [Dentipellis sp. KUC8613]|nr:Dyp-type peroxidase [Dentipellis sp. KUC8613]
MMSSTHPLSRFKNDDFKHLRHRSVRPLLPSADAEVPLGEHQVHSIWNNVQGDVFVLFPKTAENFVFFTIKDAALFKRDLKNYTPSTSLQTVENMASISHAKGRGTWAEEIVQSQIAFSRAGLDYLGYTDDIQDPRFDTRPMLDDMRFFGDSGPWYTPFAEGGLHGVFSIAAGSEDECDNATAEIKTSFTQSIVSSDEMTLKGRVRPGENKGHEHFGFRDGISQPALRGLVDPHPGQIQVDAGVIIMGYPGDPVLNNPAAPQRPAWTTDGSILIFRQLEQDVIEFDAYLRRKGRNWRDHVHGADVQPPLSDAEGAELFGAQMVGRWKSGAPIAKAPYRDDLEVAENEDEVNDFDYTVEGIPGPTNRFCPFTAHTRKTMPRNLDPFMTPKFFESVASVRAGIPYGPEVTKEERDAGASLKDGIHERGLLFVSYQSSLENGFVRQLVPFSGNDFFPITSFTPTKHGQDPIIGSPQPATIRAHAMGTVPSRGEVTVRVKDQYGHSVDVSGFASSTAIGPTADPQPFFVKSRGGEYFFVPSVSFVKKISG